MADISEKTKGQQRWDGYGKEQIERLREAPDKFKIDASFFREKPCFWDLMEALEPMKGLKVLEVGCGRGMLSVYMAKRGAEVHGVDIGPNLVRASGLLAEINRAACAFTVASATGLPFGDGCFDSVVGFSVLHHLSRKDLERALSEAARVLKAGGRAFFHEPVENSRLFDMAQNLFPSGKKGERYYRPSILQRKAWKERVARRDNRVLTVAELAGSGRGFGSVKIKPYGLSVRLARLIGARHRDALMELDTALLKAVPRLGHFCQTVLAEYGK